jgi:hypothetical protein
MKIIVGNPHGVKLSLIIITSMLVGMLVAVGGMLLIKKVQTKNKDE